MLYRAVTIGIIAFWLVMMGLLVRLETHPEATDILDVPVSYVERIMFKHGQASLLTVFQDGKHTGSISFRPTITASGERAISFSGSIALQLPMAAPQWFNFNGLMDMDAALRMLDFHLDLNIQEPRFRLDVKGDATHNILSWEAIQGTEPGMSHTLPMDATKFGPALIDELGLGSTALPMMVPTNVAPPSITARETQITLHDEQLEVYRITIQEGTAMAADIYVSQLGQVVLATTNFGYTLSTEEYP